MITHFERVGRVEVEAQRVPDRPKSLEDLHEVGWWCQGLVFERDGRYGIVIDTLEGDMEASPGDWVVCGVAGEFYPVKPEVFDATYEPVPGS